MKLSSKTDLKSKLKAIRIIGFFLVLLVGLGCQSRNSGHKNVQISQLELYAQNYQKWQDNVEGHPYEFDYNRICFCLTEFANAHVVVNEAGNVEGEKFQDVDGNEISAQGNSLPPSMTINDYFELIREKLDDPDATVRVKYDETLFYPVNIYVDNHPQTVDDEITYRISDLKIL